MDECYSIAIHGGAGSRPVAQAGRGKLIESSLAAILEEGRTLLARGGTALDAVVHCTQLLEDDPLYNAGYGSVPNAAGRFELEASVMDGRTLGAGAVTQIDSLRNPIELARLIMEKTPHILLAGQGAAEFAAANGVAIVTQEYYREGWNRSGRDSDAVSGTVGAVARDRFGNLAAATSTGGQKGKMVGRVGDSSLIGAGSYADNAGCAVSCTGWGEDFMRTALAAFTSFLIERERLAAGAAAKTSIGHLVAKVNGSGGLILVDRSGTIAAAQSSSYLHCGWIEHGGPTKLTLQAPIRIPRV